VSAFDPLQTLLHASVRRALRGRRTHRTQRISPAPKREIENLRRGFADLGQTLRRASADVAKILLDFRNLYLQLIGKLWANRFGTAQYIDLHLKGRGQLQDFEAEV
jgi:hypothetical protein